MISQCSLIAMAAPVPTAASSSPGQGQAIPWAGYATQHTPQHWNAGLQERKIAHVTPTRVDQWTVLRRISSWTLCGTVYPQFIINLPILHLQTRRSVLCWLQNNNQLLQMQLAGDAWLSCHLTSNFNSPSNLHLQGGLVGCGHLWYS